MEVIDLLKEKGALHFGDFTLASGKKSDYYIDVKRAYTDPYVLNELSGAMSLYIEGDGIAGVELGAIPLVVATAIRTGKPFYMVRKERKEHGTPVTIEGGDVSGKTIDILEDVTTTGRSVISAIGTVRASGGVVSRVITVVDRGEGAGDALEKEGVKLYSLVNASDLKGAPSPDSFK